MIDPRQHITITRESIVTIAADVIVNSANPWLGGIGPDLPEGVGGVDGAIHRAAGRGLWELCQQLPEFLGWSDGRLEMMRCSHGDLRMTEPCGLPCRKIFHAVAPRWIDGNFAELETLAALYERIFATLVAGGFSSIVLPPLGTRSFGMPRVESARAAVRTAARYAATARVSVIFSMVDSEEFDVYAAALAAAER